jgi:hypothetical protein
VVLCNKNDFSEEKETERAHDLKFCTQVIGIDVIKWYTKLEKIFTVLSCQKTTVEFL